MQLFRFLNFGLAIVLAFVGVKMLASHYVDLSIGLSLGVIGIVLAGSIAASMAFPARPGPTPK
jgi:tellurite resistance protein TerC